MNKLINSSFFLFAALCIFFISVPSVYSQSGAQSGDSQAAAQPIGIILSTRGVVTAEAEDGTVRNLRRRSKIYEGDVVITAERARAQIRFNDNGLISLRPDTRFAIEEHKFAGQEDGTESATYRLLRGGLQAITGLIGNKNKSRYRFETPLATIGLRGTHWGINFCDSSCGNLPPGLYGGVAEGGIDVCNGGGCEGFDKDGYFYVPDENTKPQTLIDPPSGVFDDTTGRDEEEEDDEDDGEGDGSEGGDGEGDGDGQAGDGEGERDEQTNEGDGEGEGDGQAQGGDEGGNEDGSDGSAGTDGGSGEEGGSDGSQDGDGGSTAGSTGNTGGSASQFSGSQGGGVNEGSDGTTPPATDTNPTDDPDPTTLAGRAQEQQQQSCTAEQEAAGQCTTTITVNEAQSAGGGSGDSGGDGDNGDGTGGTPSVIDEIDATVDTDGDGVPNGEDAFPDDPNEIADTDGDGIGDNADTDRDGDGVPNDLDPNPDTADQFADADGDGIADIIDEDADGNGILDELGDIPAGFVAIDTDGDGIADTLAEDTDGDGIANADDPDADGNGILDELGEVPANFVAIDTDGDGIADTLAEDTDGDGIANADDPDADGDGILDELGEVPANFVAVDTDGDGIADTLEPDSDGDGIADIDDLTPNGDPTPDPTPEPDPTITVAFAMVSDRSTDSAVSDVVSSDDGAGNSITRNTSGAVTAASRDDNGGCDPCLVEVDFASSTSILNDPISYTKGSISASLGRWTGTINVSENGNSSTAPDFHFVVSEDIADSLPVAGSSGSSTGPTLVSYSLDNGVATLPTDGMGLVGTLDVLDMDFDFASQEIVFVDLEASFSDGRQYVAGLVDGAVSLTGVVTRDIGLMGSCLGGSCSAGETINGSTSLFFLQDGIDSALAGSYSLNTSSYSNSIAGAYVLELAPITTPSSPFNFDRNQDTDLATILNTTPSGVAAIANIIKVPVGTGIYDFSSAATLASSNVTGQSFELIDFASRLEPGSSAALAVSAYNSGEIGQINSGFAVSSFLNIGGGSSSAYYGYWSNADQNFSDGSPQDTLGMIPFAYSVDPTSILPTTGKAFYSFRGGSAFNEIGELAVITDIDMTVDFFAQMIDDFYFRAASSTAIYTADIGATDSSTPPFVNLTSVSDIFIPLVGECDGCGLPGTNTVIEGGTTLAFIGSNAEGAIGSVELDSVVESSPGSGSYSADGQHSLAGSFVLGQDVAIPNAPNNAVALGSTILHVDTTNSIAGTLGSRTTLSVSGTADGADGINILSHIDNPGLIPANSLGVVSGSFSSNFSALDQLGALGNPACANCIDVNVDIQDSGTTLADTGSFSDTDSTTGTVYSAYWGRWNSYGDIEYLGELYDTKGDIHYIYSKNLTDLASLGITATIQYSYNPATSYGTSPTDQLGNVGTLDRVEMDINYGPQAIERFEMDLSFDTNNVWSVVMKDASVALNNNPVSSFEVVGAFGSTSVQNTGVVFGDVNTAILGPNANAVIGSYNLSVIDGLLPDNEAAGTFLLEQPPLGLD